MGMNCTRCGRLLPDGVRFCPDCGSAVPQMAANPGQLYGAPVLAAPKKKKKVWPWVLGILLIVMAALITGIVLLFRIIFQSINSQGELMQAASQNAQALSSQNGTALAGMMPEGYWDYLDETYGVSRETSKNQLNSYLGSSSLYLETEQTPAKVGFSWVASYDSRAQLQSDSCTKQEQRQCEKALSRFGLEAQEYRVITFQDDRVLSMAKIDGRWYSVDVMLLEEELCRMQASFLDEIKSYITALEESDIDTLHAMAPEDFWPLLEDYTSDTESEADTALESLLEGYNVVGNVQDVSLDWEDPVWYTQEELTVDTYALFDLPAEGYVDISCNYTITGDKDTYDGEYIYSFVLVEGTWYLYDAMLDYAEACGYFDDASDYEDYGDFDYGDYDFFDDYGEGYGDYPDDFGSEDGQTI